MSTVGYAVIPALAASEFLATIGPAFTARGATARQGELPMDLGLTGRAAIVTGGSRGIGRAIAKMLASEGVDVVICARQRQALDEAAQALSQETGRRVIPVVADTMSSESVSELVDATLSAFGRVDV